MPWLVPLLLVAAVAFDDPYRAGLRALSQNKLDEARTNLETAAQADPSSGRIWIALAQTYWKLHETAKANDAAEMAFARSKTEAPVLQLLAFFYGESGQPLKRCDLLTAYAMVALRDGDGPTKSVECYLQAQAPRQVIQVSDRGPKWNTRAEVRFARAKAFLMLGDAPRAGEEFQSAIYLNPYEESYRFEYANSLLQSQQFEAAVHVLKAAQTVFDKSPQIALAFGAGLYGLRRFDEAAASFRRTIALDPELGQPYLFLGKMLDQIPAQVPQIILLLEAFEKTHPESYVGFLVQGKALSSEPLLKKAATLNPNLAEPHYELGVLFERQRRFSDAVRELEAAAQLDPNDPATHYHLSRVYDRIGKPDLAARERDVHQRLTHPK